MITTIHFAKRSVFKFVLKWLNGGGIVVEHSTTDPDIKGLKPVASGTGILYKKNCYVHNCSFIAES
jgi:hypothetical protein